MRTLIRASFVLLCIALLSSLAIGGPVRTTDSATEEFVSFLEEAWVHAIVQKNVNVLNHIIADDFIGTSPNGYRYSKQEAISDLKSGAYVVRKMVLDNVKVRVFGDTAVVSLYQNEQSKYGDEDCTGRYAFTDVWVKRDGMWQAVASQGTPVILP